MLALSLLLSPSASDRPGANTVALTEGFESYNTDAGQTYGGLDKNVSGRANAANNGVGNPWFGPNPKQNAG